MTGGLDRGAGVSTTDAARARIDALLAQRTQANAAFFTREAERIARLCHRMAERFARGGRLVAFGATPVARSDVRHVAVEFVHPVIVGKRALPALGIASEGGALEPQVALEVESDDIAIAFGDAGDPGTRDALAAARSRGSLTLAFADGMGAEWELVPHETDDPFVRQELVETTYHVLWELVHVFFEHRGLLEGRAAGPVHDTGASSFLYPFLAEQEDDLERVVEDVRASVLMKAEAVGELRVQTLTDHAGELLDAAHALRRCLDGGGRVLALGNGGSATDAMDAVADLHEGCAGGPPRRAIDLTEDPSILTAIANDIGVEAIFVRQVIAHARAGDVLLTLSTSGNSLNVLAALREARSRDVETISWVGYDGGRVLADELADHVVVSRSEHIPRIQEAHASAWHVLRELVELVEP